MAVMACTAQTWLGACKVNAALGTIAVPVGRESRDLGLSSSEVAPLREREQLWWKSACAGATMTAEERAPWCKSKSTCDGGRAAARVMALQSQRLWRRQWRKSAHDEGRSVNKIPTVAAAAAAPLCAGSSPRSCSPLPPHRSLDSIARRDSPHVYVASPRSRPKGMSSSFRVRLFIAPSAHGTPIPTVRSSTWHSFNERGRKRRQGGMGKGSGGGGGSPPSPSPTCALGWDSILLAGFSLMVEGRRRRRAPLLLSSTTVSDDITNARHVDSHANATSSSSSSSSIPANQSNADLFQEHQQKTYDRTKGKEEEEEEEEEEGGEEEKESPSLFSSSSSSSSSSSTFSSTTNVDLIKSGLPPNRVSDGRLNRVMSTLLKDFPEVYVRELDWSVYSDDVIFVDPVVSLKGLLQHQGMYIVLRAMAWAWFEPGTAGFEIDEIKEVDPDAKTQSPFSHREYTDTLNPKRAIGMKWRTGGKTRWGTIADFSGDDVFRVGANGLIISHESSWNEDPAVVWREVFLGEERRL